MNSGLLRDRVTIQSRGSSADDGGGNAAAWVDGATVWAAIEPLDGSEQLQGLALTATVTHRIRMRYRTGVTPKNRLKFGTRRFDIRSVIDVRNRHTELEILAGEVVQ